MLNINEKADTPEELLVIAKEERDIIDKFFDDKQKDIIEKGNVVLNRRHEMKGEKDTKEKEKEAEELYETYQGLLESTIPNKTLPTIQQLLVDKGIEITPTLGGHITLKSQLFFNATREAMKRALRPNGTSNMMKQLVDALGGGEA